VGVLIDASVLVDAERGRLDLAAHAARHPDDHAYLSVITASELLHGVHRAAAAIRHAPPRPKVRPRGTRPSQQRWGAAPTGAAPTHVTGVFGRQGVAASPSAVAGAQRSAHGALGVLAVGRLQPPLQHRLAAFAATRPRHRLRSDAVAVGAGLDLRLDLNGLRDGATALVRTEGLGPGEAGDEGGGEEKDRGAHGVLLSSRGPRG